MLGLFPSAEVMYKKEQIPLRGCGLQLTPEEVAVLGDVNGQEAVLEGRSGTGLGAQVC